MDDELEPVETESDEIDMDDKAKVSREKLLQFAEAHGNISELLTVSQLEKLGMDVVKDYETDATSRSEWVESAKKYMAQAAQDKVEAKDYPFERSSNVQYPNLTVAAMQFAARAYPAIVKPDEVLGVKVLGPRGQAPQANPQAQQGQPQQGQDQSPKMARAKRVKDYLNYMLLYKMPDWEGDMDVLLHQLPVIGMAYKKIVYDQEYGTCSHYVSALNLTVNEATTDFARCPRITQDFELYPYEINSKIALGVYNDVELLDDDYDDQKPRKMLEQYTMQDLDDDDIEEPYIVTVDYETKKVLRVEASFTAKDVIMNDDKVVYIKRWNPFIPYHFLPDPKGRFHGMGFGKLLEQVTEAVNTSFNQLIDAGHAQVAGGGFISSGLRLQGAGKTASLRFRPSEYKVVDSSAGDIRGQIYERSLPMPSPVTYQMLDMLLAAAKDISAVKDVLTGDAPSNAPVGTTMALIEQGLQTFTSIYKRVYRAMRQEFRAIYECVGNWSDDNDKQEYSEFFDGDPQADFDKDFSLMGNDITPVSDPTAVTQAQRIAKAQFLQQFMALPFANAPEIMRRACEAAQIDDIDSLIMPPQEPNKLMVEQAAAELDKTKSEADLKKAQALKTVTEAGAITGEHEQNGAIHAGLQAELGGLPSMAGEPNNAMGNVSIQEGGGSPAQSVGGLDMGQQPIGQPEPTGEQQPPFGT